MPNWCSNNLHIKFSNKKSFYKWKKVFLNITKSTEDDPEGYGTLNNYFISIPDDCIKQNKFCRNNWGTEWECDITEVAIDHMTINIGYETAWTPNLKVVDEIYNRLKKEDSNIEVFLKFYEFGNGFRGRYYNGESKDIDISELWAATCGIFDDITDLIGDKISYFEENGVVIVDNLNNNLSLSILLKNKKEVRDYNDNFSDMIYGTLYNVFSESIGDFEIIRYNDLYYTTKSEAGSKYWFL